MQACWSEAQYNASIEAAEAAEAAEDGDDEL